jgi:hypothetical protein
MASSNAFKIVLANMQHEELLNFIWIYDQYVQSVVNDIDDEGAFPLNIERFYHEVYKKQLKPVMKETK